VQVNLRAEAMPGEASAKLDMPATPLRIWQASQASEGGES
jgi:hypothetical protein